MPETVISADAPPRTVAAVPETPMPTGYAARLGRWSFRHRWTVVAVWLVAIVIGVLSAGPVFSALGDDNGPSSLESVQGNHQIDAASTTGDTIVGVFGSVDPGSAAVATTVNTAAAALAHLTGVTAVVTPFDTGRSADDRSALTAKDHQGFLVRATLAQDADDSVTDAVETRLGGLAATLRAGPAPQATVLVGGGSIVDDQANTQAQTDLSRAEVLSLPITLIILVIVFAGLIAAGLPIIAAITSIAASLSILFIFTKFTSIDSDAVTVITLLGLGLSIDYGLLLVARYRDELAKGVTSEMAVARAWATAGRTIFFSGLTVAASLTGMLVFGITALSALGAAGVSITLVAMCAALTLTAALLRFAGRRIRPAKQRTSAQDGRGFFGRLALLVQRKPLVTAIGTAVVLLAAGLPVLGMTVHIDNLDGLPRSLPAVRALDVLSTQYAESQATAVTVVAHTGASALDAWAQPFTTAPGVLRVHPATQISPALSTIDIDTTGSPEGPDALRLVDRIRADRPAGGTSWVTGDAAVHRDLVALIEHRLPYAILLTLVVMFLLLFAMTGSVVVPIKAIAMNVVSLAATFGVLVAVFEHGFAAGLLHTTTVGGISPFVVVTVFAFAFGLSMDYEVFLLARIKEQVDLGTPTDLAVRRGLQTSGRIITSAALLMVVVFSCFITGRIGNIQQIGLGLAVAVAIDATLVRCVLVPATMTLLGRTNWWSPRWLTKIHRGLHLDQHMSESTPSPAP